MESSITELLGQLPIVIGALASLFVGPALAIVILQLRKKSDKATAQIPNLH